DLDEVLEAAAVETLRVRSRPVVGGGDRRDEEEDREGRAHRSSMTRRQTSRPSASLTRAPKPTRALTIRFHAGTGHGSSLGRAFRMSVHSALISGEPLGRSYIVANIGRILAMRVGRRTRSRSSAPSLWLIGRGGAFAASMAMLIAPPTHTGFPSTCSHVMSS